MAKTTPGDTARDRPEKESPISVLAGRIGLPVADDGTKARAALFLHRGGNGDLWEVLGLDEYIRGRQVALGLIEPPEPVTDVSCPDCKAGPGESCRSTGGRKVSRHVARQRLAGRIDNTEGESE